MPAYLLPLAIGAVFLSVFLVLMVPDRLEMSPGGARFWGQLPLYVGSSSIGMFAYGLFVEGLLGGITGAVATFLIGSCVCIAVGHSTEIFRSYWLATRWIGAAGVTLTILGTTWGGWALGWLGALVAYCLTALAGFVLGRIVSSSPRANPIAASHVADEPAALADSVSIGPRLPSLSADERLAAREALGADIDFERLKRQFRGSEYRQFVEHQLRMNKQLVPRCFRWVG